MSTTRTNLVLILARDLAANLATPIFVVNTEGTLVFFNESAEELLGRSYAEVGPLSQSEWGSMWEPTDQMGRPISPDDLPLSRTLSTRHPTHQAIKITRPDGIATTIEVTSLPLFAHVDDFVGAVAIFWDPGGVDR